MLKKPMFEEPRITNIPTPSIEIDSASIGDISRNGEDGPIMAIEKAIFGEEAWKKEDFIKKLMNKNTPCKVAKVGRTVVGYIIYSPDGVVRIAADADHPGHDAIIDSMLKNMRESQAGKYVATLENNRNGNRQGIV